MNFSALTSRQGTVTIVLGQRAGSGITSSGRFGVFERAATDPVMDGSSTSSDGSIADATAGSITRRIVNAQRGAEGQSDAAQNASTDPNQTVLFEPEVNVGEIDVLTCDAPPADTVVQPEDC